MGIVDTAVPEICGDKAAEPLMMSQNRFFSHSTGTSGYHRLTNGDVFLDFSCERRAQTPVVGCGCPIQVYDTAAVRFTLLENLLLYDCTHIISAFCSVDQERCEAAFVADIRHHVSPYCPFMAGLLVSAPSAARRPPGLPARSPSLDPSRCMYFDHTATTTISTTTTATPTKQHHEHRWDAYCPV